MNVPDCYRLLGLRTGASFEEIKASYRRLARQYHPDVNPDNRDQAQDKFIQLTEAYKFLVSTLNPDGIPIESPRAPASSPKSSVRVEVRSPKASAKDQPKSSSHQSQAPGQGATRSTEQTDGASAHPNSSPKVQVNPDLSVEDQKLKESAYTQLQALLKQQRFPRAIALVEGLAQRIPHDPEVRQWQAITYQRWGRQLTQDRQFDKARIYLKKALRTDPHNRSLWLEVERDFRRLEQQVL